MNWSHTHKTRFWYLSGVLFKISDDHPRPLLYRSPPPLPPGILVPVWFIIISWVSFYLSKLLTYIF